MCFAKKQSFRLSFITLRRVFAFREKRIVTKDFTIRWRNRFFLLKKQSIAIKKRRVTVLENLNDEVKIYFNGRFREFEEITKHTLENLRKNKKTQNSNVPDKPKQPWKPAKNHPWRQQNRALFKQLSR